MFFRKHTGTQKTISFDFITVLTFYRLCKGKNNNDGFFCKVLDKWCQYKWMEPFKRTSYEHLFYFPDKKRVFLEYLMSVIDDKL